jgi:CO/xanthine dehydrogenase Mo-binding subunit
VGIYRGGRTLAVSGHDGQRRSIIAHRPKRDLDASHRVITQPPAPRSPPWPPLATDKVRYVGEAIAACVAPTRSEAEDLPATVTVDYRPLHAVTDVLTQSSGSPALVHEYFGNNLYQERTFAGDDIKIAARTAEVTSEPVDNQAHRWNAAACSPIATIVWSRSWPPPRLRTWCASSSGKCLGIEERCINELR